MYPAAARSMTLPVVFFIISPVDDVLNRHMSFLAENSLEACLFFENPDRSADWDSLKLCLPQDESRLTNLIFIFSHALNS